MYRIYKKILHSDEGDLIFFGKISKISKKFYGSFQGAPRSSGRYHMYETAVITLKFEQGGFTIE